MKSVLNLLLLLPCHSHLHHHCPLLNHFVCLHPHCVILLQLSSCSTSSSGLLDNITPPFQSARSAHLVSQLDCFVLCQTARLQCEVQTRPSIETSLSNHRRRPLMVKLTCPDASELETSPAAVELRFLFGARLVLVVSSDAHVLHLTMSNGQSLRGAATDPRLAVGCLEVRKKAWRPPEIDGLKNSSPSAERSLWQGKKR